MVAKNAGRSGRPWKRKKKAFRDKCAKVNAPCWLCNGLHGPIRYDLPDTHKWGFNADHAIVWASLAEGDPRREDERNLRPAHRHCNLVRNDGRGDVQARILGKRKPAPFTPDGW